MPAWWTRLFSPSETPLKALETDDITAENLVDRLHRLERLMGEYRMEWGDHLEKMNSLAGRLYARDRMRRKKQEEEEEQEEMGEQPVMPVLEPRPAAPLSFDRFDKASVRAYLRSRG